MYFKYMRIKGERKIKFSLKSLSFFSHTPFQMSQLFLLHLIPSTPPRFFISISSLYSQDADHLIVALPTQTLCTLGLMLPVSGTLTTSAYPSTSLSLTMSQRVVSCLRAATVYQLWPQQPGKFLHHTVGCNHTFSQKV